MKYKITHHYRIINGTTTYGEYGAWLQKLLKYGLLIRPKHIEPLLPF